MSKRKQNEAQRGDASATAEPNPLASAATVIPPPAVAALRQPSISEVRAAKRILVRTEDPRSSGLHVGGEQVSPEPREVDLERVRAFRGQSFADSFATFPGIVVEVVE